MKTPGQRAYEAYYTATGGMTVWDAETEEYQVAWEAAAKAARTVEEPEPVPFDPAFAPPGCVAVEDAKSDSCSRCVFESSGHCGHNRPCVPTQRPDRRHARFTRETA